ncbi:hypothetical protein CEXT_809781 [Caerostris extrusa]|uniref:Uncharacterized protein n=1 Tax=Caerostris extrusa TaxID=172846 RepID=A0AAV4WYM6_CAEEX|nr:hypothetical protein CEXT_809781 [Caerostris extrusa]
MSASTKKGEQLKIFPANSDIHRAITKYLTDGKIEFYVITPKNQRPLKAVLKASLSAIPLMRLPLDLLNLVSR